MSKVEIIYDKTNNIVGYKTSDDKVFEKQKEADAWQFGLNQLNDLSKLFGFMGGI